MAATKYKRVFA